MMAKKHYLPFSPDRSENPRSFCEEIETDCFASSAFSLVCGKPFFLKTPNLSAQKNNNQVQV
jgi:hypothetical protein